MSESKAGRTLATREQAEAEVARVTHFLALGHPVKGRPGDRRGASATRLAGDSLGIDKQTFRERIGTPSAPGSYFRTFGLAPDWSIPARRGELGTAPVLPGFAIKETTRRLGRDGKFAGETIKQARAPGAPFVAPAGMRLKHVSALTDGDGREVLRWHKLSEERDPADVVEAIKAAFADFSVRAPAVPPPAATDTDLATVYPLADLHLGLLTWRRETGVNWDLSIAQATIRDTVDRLVAAAPASRQAVILGLGDLLHADGYDNCTPRSKNVLDVDGRYPKILKAATFLMIAAVDAALHKHERVLVRVLRGNHDRESAIAVALGLSLHYASNPRVEVDDDPGYYWWWSWGSTLLGATHGDAAKMADLPLIMATRNAEAWGRSRFRSILTGHVHTRTAIETSGVTVESFQTPIPPDAWHAEMGYGAGRSLTAITYHRAHGETGRAKVNILPPAEAA